MTDSNDTDADRVTRRRTLKGIGTGASLAALGGAGLGSAGATAGNDPEKPTERWPQFQYDTANTGHGPPGGPRDNPIRKWKSDKAMNIFRAGPVVADGMVYCGNWDSYFFAWDEATGEVEWSRQLVNAEGTAAGITHSAAVAYGNVYVHDDYGNLFSLDAKTGKQNWRIGATGVGASDPTVVDGTVYVGAYGETAAVDAATGETIWHFTESGTGQNSGAPAVKDGKVFLAGTPKLALDAKTGEEIWRQDYSGASEAGTVWDGIFYVPSGKAMFAYDAETGEKAFEGRQFFPKDDDKRTDDQVKSSPAVADGTLYFQSQNAQYAVDAKTADLRWKVSGRGHPASPAVTRGVAHFGGHGYDAETGEHLYKLSRGSGASDPAVANNSIYIGTGKRVDAFEEH